MSFIIQEILQLTNIKKLMMQMVGGGAGMLLSCQPLFDCLDEIKSKNKDAYIIFPLLLLNHLDKMMQSDLQRKKI
jgi:tRNA (guanine37-N1)-methyltransferase